MLQTFFLSCCPTLIAIGVRHPKDMHHFNIFLHLRGMPAGSEKALVFKRNRRLKRPSRRLAGLNQTSFLK